MRQKTFFFGWAFMAQSCLPLLKSASHRILCLMFFFVVFGVFCSMFFLKIRSYVQGKVCIMHFPHWSRVEPFQPHLGAFGDFRDFTLCWLVELRKAFDDSDFNKDGYLDKEELPANGCHIAFFFWAGWNKTSPAGGLCVPGSSLNSLIFGINSFHL